MSEKIERNYYEILGFDKENYEKVTKAEIRKSFKILSQRNHPDKHGGAEEYIKKFKEIKKAYEVLYNEETRKRYDDNDFVNVETSEDQENIAVIVRYLQPIINENNFNPNIDYLKTVSGKIEGEIVTLNVHLRNIDDLINKLQKLPGSYKTKNKNNFFDLFIEQEKDYQLLNVEMTKAKIEIFERVLEFIKDYEFQGLESLPGFGSSTNPFASGIFFK